MSQKATAAKVYPSPAHVWTGLGAKQRAEAIYLMAQLAFNLIEAQAITIHQEKSHVTVNSSEDSPRPS
jgi:hypothetical protein